ncbi:cytochrome-c peroxidase [Aquisalimonas asiatica]|uniref:Methylamine utilization protein MauG n=1 Tax=Aquisalimonas asiatica TaxID=406100 RepID=A0A1H8QU84_9GAMM|nr:cytochrome c peroxidase [Aquisalimonas asiatica]SEO57742.1 cytochrome c peroxidase [Aquisalimonas asiatica]
MADQRARRRSVAARVAVALCVLGAVISIASAVLPPQGSGYDGHAPDQINGIAWQDVAPGRHPLRIWQHHCLPVPDGASADELRIVYSQPRACWPRPQLAKGVIAPELGHLPAMPYPEDNPPTAEKEELGRHLFFDPRLSRSEQLACASCHDADLGWSDGRRVPFGHDRRTGDRNSMSLLNAGYQEALLWDGRADSLEEQALLALEDPREMNADRHEAAARIGRITGYAGRFEAAFGDPHVSPERIAKALATFVRSITSRTSDFDRFLDDQPDRLNDDEIRGLHTFRTKARCMNCHSGALMSDQAFHNLGLHFFGRTHEDRGRYNVTGEPEDVGAFRTPSLRDVTERGPWMHNGLFTSLEAVLNLYNAGGAHPQPREHVADHPLFPETSRRLQPLRLTQAELDEIIAFLESISTRPRRIGPPEDRPE